METKQSLPAREVERMMELHDVLLKAMTGTLSWAAAAEIIGVTPRTMRRWRARLEKHGYSGLRDGRKGKPSFRRVPLATCQEVLRLYQEKYFDLNVQHFHEKLKEVEGIQLSYRWVKQALQGAGLVARKRKRGTQETAATGDAGDHAAHRWQQAPLVPRRALLRLHRHPGRRHSRIYYAQLVEEESTLTVMAALREAIRRQGLSCSLYSDRGSHFFYTPKAGEPVDMSRLTQVGRALKELGIQMIPAYSPQARGRDAAAEPVRGACHRSCAWLASPR